MNSGMSGSAGKAGKSRECCGSAPVNTAEALDFAIELLEDIQRLVGGGKPKTLRVRYGEKTIARVPLALTAAAAFAAGLAAVLLTKLAIEIEHESEEKE